MDAISKDKLIKKASQGLIELLVRSSLDDLLIIGQTTVMVNMTQCFHAHCLHNAIVVRVSFEAGSPFTVGLFFSAWSPRPLCELCHNSHLAGGLPGSRDCQTSSDFVNDEMCIS